LLPNKTLFFVLLAAWLLLFQFLGTCTFGYVDTKSIMYWMINAYAHSNGDEAHGFIIPFVVLTLLYVRRDKLLALPTRMWSPALLFLAVMLALHTLGYRVQQQRISIVAFFGGIYALIGLAWGPAWLRGTFFPYFLFIFNMPISSIAEPITFRMRLAVSKMVAAMADMLGMDVERDGTQLFNHAHTYGYEVAAACSGLRSSVAIFGLATVYGFVTFESNRKRVIMMAAAFPLAMIGNVVRMMGIIFSAELWGQGAGNYVHESAFFSLVPYVPAMAGLMLLAHWLRDKKPADPVLPLEAKHV